jgi:hypothetical protein
LARGSVTPDEQAEIVEQLQQIKELVKTTHSLSEAQTLFLEARLDPPRGGRRSYWPEGLAALVLRSELNVPSSAPS